MAETQLVIALRPLFQRNLTMYIYNPRERERVREGGGRRTNGQTKQYAKHLHTRNKSFIGVAFPLNAQIPYL